MNGNNELAMNQASPLPVDAIRSPAWYQQLASVLIWLMVAGGVVWSIMIHSELWTDQVVMPNIPVSQYAVDAHRIYTQEEQHAVEVAMTDEYHLVNWLSKRVGARIAPPALGLYNYVLLGGRLLPVGDQPAAQYMYTAQDDEKLTLFISSVVSPEQSDGIQCRETRDSLMVCSWQRKALSYAIASNTTIAGLREVANYIRPQLPNKNTLQ